MRALLGLLLLALTSAAQTTGPIDINRRARPPAPSPEVIVIPDDDEQPPRLERSGSAEAQPEARAPETHVPDTRPAADPNDPGPPVLRRRSAGVNADRERHTDRPFPVEPPVGGFPDPPLIDEDVDDDPPREASSRPAPRLHPDPVIARAMEANQEFSHTLPNFICTQLMERARSPNLGKKWDEDEPVEAEVLVIDDQETYQNIKIGGEPYNGRMMDIVGTRSSGEYGTVLWNLFAPETKAKFRSAGEETIRNREALVYTFHVEQPRSHWRIHANNWAVTPGYSGRVWIEKGTGRALRIEKEALQLPSDYPMRSAELEMDFDDVEIGGQTYLLPVEAGHLSCRNGGATCIRNRITWSHHRRFDAVSSVFNTDSTVDFGDEAAEVEVVPEIVYPDPK